MDIFNAGVVHPTGAPGLRVQSALKNRTKNGGANFRPVEVLAGLVDNQVNNLFIQTGDDDAFIREQAPIHIGECCKVIIHVGVSLFRFGIQHLEQVNQGAAGLTGVIPQIVLEHFMSAAKNSGVLGIQAEYQPDAKGVQAL